MPSIRFSVSLNLASSSLGVSALSDNWGDPDENGWQKSTLEFGFYHSLVDDDPAHAAPALEALGRAAACWARLEHHIDALIVQVNKPQHDERLFEPHPVSFGKKIDLLKRWFNQYPPLAEYIEDMRWFTSRMKTLAKNEDTRWLSRNLLLHAIPASFDAEKQTITLHHMRWVGEMIHSRHVSVTIDQLTAFYEAVQLANQFLGSITQELFTDEGYRKISGTL